MAGLLSDMRKAVQFTPAAPSWTRAESAHLTLQFLGDTAEERVGELAAALDRAAARLKPFEVGLRGLGGFPNMRRPRVLWLGAAEGAAELQAARDAVVRETQAMGIPPEERPFHAHLTLARIKNYKGVEAMMDRLRRFEGKSAGRFTASEIVLFRSQLHPQGALYTALHTAKFDPRDRSA
ncbi:MAG: RNA 2',3'-cyclic phosphodiesterase [Candidatus Sumerlaeia bacterium]